MPSENDSPQETKSRKPIEQESSFQAWERRVRQALHANDSEALRNLFAELSDLVPSESVSHEWLRVVSGWDAEAKTG
jgi:hypothetical protein